MLGKKSKNVKGGCVYVTKIRTKRYRDFWYQGVLDMIKSYPKLEADGSELALRYKKAIDDAFIFFGECSYGEDLKKVINLRYIKGTHTVVGISDKMHISERTVQEWSEKFVRKVAENVGLSKKEQKKK